MIRSAVLLFFLLIGPALAQTSFPGGELSERPCTRVPDKGAHPRIVVHTVPDLRVTATCLALRYRHENSGATAAHLYEHLLYRTAPGKRAGGLLLRTEELGAQARARVSPSLVLFSEIVPAEEGLDSLELQMSRLRAVPKDQTGILLEKRAIGQEIRAAENPAEKARRELLSELGVEADVEGDLDALHALQRSDLEELLKQVNLEQEVVIAVVGPHTNREVRQHLSRHLEPVLPQNPQAQPRPAAPKVPRSSRTAPSPYGPQVSYFLPFSTGGSSNLAPTVELLLGHLLGPGHQIAAELESDQVLRVDVSPPIADLQALLSSQALGGLDSEKLRGELEREWLKRWASPLERAEFLAEASLHWEKASPPPDAEKFQEVQKQALGLLQRLPEQASVLTLTGEPSNPSAGLYPYKTVARRRPAGSLSGREKLPNGIEVTRRESGAWPTVAVSGFFRIRRPIGARQARTLQQDLQTRVGKSLQFEVRSGGLFFHTWCRDSELAETLQKTAETLKQLALLEDPLGQPPLATLTPVEQFFLPQQQESAATLRGRDLFNPNDTHLVVVGAIDPDQLERGLRPAWSGWFRDKTPPKFYSPSERPTWQELPAERTLETASRQGLMLVGFQGPGRSNPDFFAFNLAMQTLAGLPSTSTLARALRDRLRVVDSVRVFPLDGSAHLTEDERELQTWVVAMRLTGPLQDREELMSVVEDQLTRSATRGLPESDLSRARSYLKGRLRLATSTHQGRAQVLAHSEFHRLSDTYSQDYAGLYDNLKRPQVKAACTGYLKSPQLRWLHLREATGISDEAPKSLE